MATLYTIADWNEIYENHESRKRKELRWVGIPNRHDTDGYVELMDHPNGAAHYGAWVTIAQVASRCRPRGRLCRPSGEPYNSTTLNRRTRIPVEVYDEAIPRFLLLGWLVKEEVEVMSTQWLTDVPEDAH